MGLGRALEGMGHWKAAADAYRQAMMMRRQVGERHMAIESVAGLARVLLAQGDLPQAQTLVQEILAYLETSPLRGVEEPFRVYLTCYRILCAGQDPRAKAILETARDLLEARAAKISDERMRRSFLENVTIHREIVFETSLSGLSPGRPLFPPQHGEDDPH